MKNKIQFCLVFFMIMIMLVAPVYATSNLEEKKSFFEITNSELTINDKVEMIINVEQIKYEKSIIEISTSENIENIEIEENENIDVEIKNDEICMEIDKSICNLDTISLIYNIPNNKKVGDTIKFIVNVKNYEDFDEFETLELEVNLIEEKQIVEKDENLSDDLQEDVKTDDKIINDVDTNKEEKENTEQSNQNSKNELEKNTIEIPDIRNEFTTQAQSKSVISSSDSNNSGGQNNTKTALSSSTVNEEQAVIYKGSYNNYLSELSVEGYSLNKSFSKENNTYFVNVSNDVESLNITAIAEESTGVVCIYGNKNLKIGTNKILISVTAENGNVRNYRIYVIKNS